MRRILIVAGLTAAVAAPSIASARTYCEQRSHDRKVAGTVIGALGGAIVGNAVSHRNGALIGGVGGAVLGNQVARIKCYDGPRTAYRSSRVRPARSVRAAPSADRYYTNASYRTNCRWETRPFYDERGQLVYAPTQVCR